MRMVRPGWKSWLLTTALYHVRNTLREQVLVALCGVDVIEYPLVRTPGSLRGLKGPQQAQEAHGAVHPLYRVRGRTYRFEAIGRGSSTPPNLEYLTLTDDLGWNASEYLPEDHQVLGVLQQWLGRYQVSTPHLQGITLKLGKTSNNWTLSAKQELRRLCAEVGVKLVQIERIRRG